MNNKRNPIIIHGEKYSKPVIKKGGPSKQPKISFEEARLKITEEIESTSKQINSLSRKYKMPNEIVLCLRMNPEFSAKSYYPNTLFESDGSGAQMEEIGSRLWRQQTNTIQRRQDNVKLIEKDTGKLIFVRTTEIGLQKFKQKINNTVNKSQFEIDIRKLEKVNLLSPEEQILGFNNDWTEGIVEAVIHPFQIDQAIALEQFLSIAQDSGVNPKSIQLKQYENGITFISLMADKKIINLLSGYNPLRNIHPLTVRDLPDVNRTAPIKGLPKKPIFKKRPAVKLGVLDGGFKKGNGYLDNYVEVEDTLTDEAIDMGLEHGTLVTSAALYGPLNSYTNSDTLPEPLISVRNFRVLSKGIVSNINLYGAINEIEKIVPANPDISVYNLSFGPKGQINDDDITRFTYSCDLLSKKYNVLFCVAVGNDGEMLDYDRIQAPSDIVNGLGVGAYTIANNKKVHASYSCKGPGREGNKLKPDIVGFGGCERFPTQLIAPAEGYRVYTYGTSFASPLVAATATQLIGASNKSLKSLVARALIIHSAKESNNSLHCNLMGHGPLPDDITDIVTCADRSYTLIIEDEIPVGKYIQYTIPWIENLIDRGIVKFRWTTAVLTEVDPLSTDDYTSSSIQTSFYPNSRKFKFVSADKRSTKLLDVDKNNLEIQRLMRKGWIRGQFPASVSGPQPYEKENDLRSDLKWDSIDYRSKNIKASGVRYPMFHVHSLKRGVRANNSKVKFALILTIHTPKSNVDIYPRILGNYSNLVPLKIQVENRIRVLS